MKPRAVSRRAFLQAGTFSGVALALGAGPESAPARVRARSLRGVRLGTYASKGPLDHSTNTHWIETPGGVFVIDAQWTLPEARSALAAIREEAGDKPLLGLLITHDHTDHYGGANVFVQAAEEAGQDDFPVYASAQARLSIQNDAQGFQANRKQQFGAAFPDRLVVPDRVVRDGEIIDLAVVQLRVVERYLNEAPATTLVLVEGAAPGGADALITGDLVYDRRLAIYREGMMGLENWRLQLQALQAEYPEALLYPGHGGARPAAGLIPEQVAVHEAFRDPVLRAVERDGRLTDAVRSEIKADLVEQFRAYVPVIGLTHEQIVDQSLAWLAEQVDEEPPVG